MVTVYKVILSNGWAHICLPSGHCLALHICNIAPSLRQFIPNILQMYHHFFLSAGCACDICDEFHLHFLWPGSPDDSFPTAHNASLLRMLLLIGSLIRCKIIQVYSFPFFLQAKLLRVPTIPSPLSPKLSASLYFTSERVDPSPVPRHSSSTAQSWT
jgi:hypothetical protein